MMWRYNQDDTPPVLTARDNIENGHSERIMLELPETAIVFFMGKGVEYLTKMHHCTMITNRFPRFLAVCPIYSIDGHDVCFLNGGAGAPQAVDTLETLAELGVKNIICAGMFGAFSDKVNVGDIIAPSRAFVEEGTSLHYYESIEYAEPDKKLTALIAARGGISSYPIVTTDAVYRQTFYKERLWREKGAVGVDMETSAMFSVGKYLGIRVAAILAASDKAPMSEHEPGWKWSMTHDMRKDISALAAGIAMQI